MEYTRQLAVETNRLSEFTRWLVGVTGLMALIAIFQLWMFKRQLNLMEDGARDARNVASAAQCSANAAKASADALMLAERAYVKLSHVTPGLKIKEGKSFCEVEIEIRNHGRTPATVTDVHIWGKLLEHGEPLPVPFQYPPQEQSPSAFLVTQEAFFKTQVLPLLGIQSEEVICSAKRLWVYGHVDYIDVFGRRYQGGYARIHEPWLGDGLKEPNRNNLVYPIDGRYNYDRLREPGEGNDWGEKVTS